MCSSENYLANLPNSSFAKGRVGLIPTSQGASQTPGRAQETVSAFQHWQHFQASDYSDWQMGILNLTDPRSKETELYKWRLCPPGVHSPDEEIGALLTVNPSQLNTCRQNCSLGVQATHRGSEPEPNSKLSGVLGNMNKYTFPQGRHLSLTVLGKVGKGLS